MSIFKFSRKSLQQQKGFTLIEVMIAVVVFSFGLLGVAGVMIVSVKSNHNGYMRSQANFLAHSIIDMMSKNKVSVWQNQYNGSYNTFTSITSCAAGSPCNCAAVATRDVQLWSNLIQQTLPNGVGQIQCVPTGAIPAVTCGDANIPYAGICTVTVSWNEANEASATSAQQFVISANP